MLQRILRSGYVRARRRAQDLSPAENARARADRPRVAADFPWIAGHAGVVERVQQRFGAHHKDYITRVGHPNHAASMELISFLWALCEGRRPAKVVDLGSGFTSFVLRTWAASAGAEAWSVDDSAEWLERTRAYLDEKGVSSERLLTWERASGAEGPRGFDLVLHDMGTMDTRARTLEEALDLAAPGGVVILDDVHKPEYRAVAKAALERRQLPWYSLKPWTRDGICRYAWMVIR